MQFDSWLRKMPWRKKSQPTFSILAWEIPWTEKPGGLQSMVSQRVGHNWVTEHKTLSRKKKKKEKDVTIQQKIVCALMNWLESRDIWNKICSSGHKDKLLNLSCRQAVDYIFLCATYHNFFLPYLPGFQMPIFSPLV